jgi:hypothetical protein
MSGFFQLCRSQLDVLPVSDGVPAEELVRQDARLLYVLYKNEPQY